MTLYNASVYINLALITTYHISGDKAGKHNRELLQLTKVTEYKYLVQEFIPHGGCVSQNILNSLTLIGGMIKICEEL